MKKNKLNRRQFINNTAIGVGGLTIFPGISYSANEKKYPYMDISLSAEKRVDDLLSRMSIDEKIGQLMNVKGKDQYTCNHTRIELTDEFKKQFAKTPVGMIGGLCRADWWAAKNWETGLTPELVGKTINRIQKYAIENSRWGIPFWISEVSVHGLDSLGATVFPTGIAMGSTWNSSLIHEVACVIAKEVSTIGGHRGSPSLDIARDPRWSRVEECFGEDPFLVSQLAVSMVKGMQGETFPTKDKIVCVLRHFAAHGDPEGGHNSAPCHVGPIELHNIQLKPFRDCVAAGARGVMSSYNNIDGIPCTGNHELLTGILREKWGFQGYVVSDAGAIGGLVGHRVAKDMAEACAVALKAGVDLDMWSFDKFPKGIHEAFKRGLLKTDDIDRAARRFLLLKFQVGLFDYPFVDETKPAKILGCKEHLKVALEVARQSLVLLSNPNKKLPLSGVKNIAVIGPNADEPMNQMGDYTAIQHREDIITVLDGVKKIALKRNINVRYSKGCKVRSLKKDDFSNALKITNESDAVVLVIGGSSAPDASIVFLDNGASQSSQMRENLECDKDSGEGFDRASLRLGGVQMELFRELKKTGKPVIVVLIMGRPLVINDIINEADAVLLAWYPGMMGGQAVAEALFGEYNPGGKLPISFPDEEGQIPVYYNSQAYPRRNYIDLSGTPRLRFGFGLSYTSFAYFDLELSKKNARIGDSIECSVKIKNTGDVDGDEIVQLYITDMVASVSLPMIQLKGFQRIHLNAGETEIVTFLIGNEELGFYNNDLEYVVEPGEFTIAVGNNLDLLLKTELEVLL